MIIQFKRMKQRKQNKKVKTTKLIQSENKKTFIERGYQSDSQPIQEQFPVYSSVHLLPKDHDKEFEEDQMDCSSAMQKQQVGPVIIAEEESEIKDILLKAGLLYVEIVPINNPLNDPLVKCASWPIKMPSEQTSYYDCRCEGLYNFYDEKQFQNDCYWKKNYLHQGGEE